MSIFNTKYNEYKQIYSMISEETVRDLYPAVEKILLGRRKWSDLNDQEKQQLQQTVYQHCEEIKQRVEEITPNKQYQSWLFGVLKREEQDINEDYNDLKNTITLFEKLCRSPKYNSSQKNIQNYKTFEQLHRFVYEAVNKNSKYEDVEFPLLYSNNKYNIYKVGMREKDKFQRMYGPNGFNTAWCVANSENDYFEHYLYDAESDYYILWLTKDNKPFALLHYDSDQFKNVHDDEITDTSDEIIDGLINTGFNIKHAYRGDLAHYKFTIYKKTISDDPNCEEKFIKYVCRQFGLTYNKKTNALDVCSAFRYSITDNYISIPKELVDEKGELTVSLGEGFEEYTIYAINIGLTSLKGFPKKIKSLNVSENNISSVENCPIRDIHTTLQIDNNKLTSLSGLQHLCLGNLYVRNNQLQNLDYCPIVNNSLRADNNNITNVNLTFSPYILGLNDNKITSLSNINVPVDRLETLHCSNNLLSDLNGCPPIYNLWVKDNQIKTVEDVMVAKGKIQRSLRIYGNPVCNQLKDTHSYNEKIGCVVFTT